MPAAASHGCGVTVRRATPGAVRATLWCETQTPDQKTGGSLRERSALGNCHSLRLAYVQVSPQAPKPGKPSGGEHVSHIDKLFLWQDWSYEEAILISEDPQNLGCVLAHNWTEYAHPPVWSIERFGAKTSFALPANADSLSLLARGSYQHGHVEFVQSTEESDTVDVSVRVAYRFEEAIEHAAVCLTGNGENEYGIGIFVRSSFLFTSSS